MDPQVLSMMTFLILQLAETFILWSLSGWGDHSVADRKTYIGLRNNERAITTVSHMLTQAFYMHMDAKTEQGLGRGRLGLIQGITHWGTQ
jgi:hypothetical protein